MTTPSDQRVRDRIRDDLDTTLVIEAAAGTVAKAVAAMAPVAMKTNTRL